MKRDFISIADLAPADLEEIFSLAQGLKADRQKGWPHPIMAGKTLAMIFEKPSLRTRVTFEAGMVQLGGYAIYLSSSDIGLGTRETVPDVARNLSRWVDIIMARTFSHQVITELAQAATVIPAAITSRNTKRRICADFSEAALEAGGIAAVLRWRGRWLIQRRHGTGQIQRPSRKSHRPAPPVYSTKMSRCPKSQSALRETRICTESRW